MNLSAETLHFIEEHRHDDVRTLALQGKKYPGVDMALAVTQISGRQIAEQKIPSWYAIVRIALSPAFVNGTVLVRVDGKV